METFSSWLTNTYTELFHCFFLNVHLNGFFLFFFFFFIDEILFSMFLLMIKCRTFTDILWYSFFLHILLDFQMSQGSSVIIMIHSHPGKSKVYLVGLTMKLIIAMLMTPACLFLILVRLVF